MAALSSHEMLVIQDHTYTLAGLGTQGLKEGVMGGGLI